MGRKTRVTVAFSILFALLLVFGLAAAGKSETTTSGTMTSADDGPFSKYPQLVTARMIDDVSQGDDWKLQALKTLGETPEDNRYTRQILDKLNVKVVYDWIVDSSQFTQKLKVTIASGNIPDITRVQLTDLNQLASAGLIQPMGPSYDKYASDLTKKFTTQDGGLIMSAISVDGKMMGLPQPTASIGNNQYLWLRTDWMEKLGIAAPKTMNEFIAMMKAFVERDPDGNGKNDTYAMLLSKPTDQEYWGMWQTLQGFFWCFDAWPMSWIKDSSGKLVYAATLPNMKNALRTLQTMYKSGWIDPEFTVKDFDKAKEIVAAGKVGVEFGYHWTTHISLKFSRDNDPKADWGAFEMPSATGNIVKSRTDLGLRSTFVVRKDYKYPEAIVKMMNLYNEDNFGATADYEYWSQPYIGGKLVNDIWYLGPVDSLYDWIDVDPIDAIQPAFAGTIKPETLKGTAASFYNNCINDWAWLKMFGPGEHAAGYYMSRAVHNPDKYIQANLFVGAPTPTMVERWAQLLELRDAMVTNIIIGKLDVDSGFDTFVADWKRIGGDKITTEVNAWYQANVAKK